MKDIVWTMMVVVIMLLGVGAVRHSMNHASSGEPQEAKVATKHSLAASHQEEEAKPKTASASSPKADSSDRQLTKNDKPHVDVKHVQSDSRDKPESSDTQTMASQITRKSLEHFEQNQRQVAASGFDNTSGVTRESDDLDPARLYGRLQRMVEEQ